MLASEDTFSDAASVIAGLAKGPTAMPAWYLPFRTVFEGYTYR